MVTNTATKGISTLEIVIAFAILTLTLTGVISLVFGNRTVVTDAQVSAEALARATDQLENARQLSENNFFNIVGATTNETVDGLEYQKTLEVSDVTACLKQATSTVSWDTDPLRPQRISLAGLFSDVVGTLKLGGDCVLSSPDGWTKPKRFASDTFNPGKPTILDALHKKVYVGVDKDPFLKIVDVTNATLGQTNGLILSFTNAFSLGVKPFSLDAIEVTSGAGQKKQYVYIAASSPTAQLMVVDATDPTQPTLSSTIGLSPCVTGSFPQGWYVYAYDTRLYMVTRETTGPEFHVFSLSSPSTPSELSVGGSTCKGYELNATVEQLIVRDQVVGGVQKRYAYLVTDQNTKEIRVLDVTDPYAITEKTSVDLPGSTDAASLDLVGNKLYVGRLNVSGVTPELLVYDVANPPSGLTLLGSKDIGTSVLGIRVVGNLAFLATAKTNQEFQVWNIKNPADIKNVAVFNFGNVVGQGIDYEPNYIYITGQATPNFQVLYSAP